MNDETDGRDGVNIDNGQTGLPIVLLSARLTTERILKEMGTKP